MAKKINYTAINASTVDRWVEEGWEWGVPITHQQYLDACNGKWQVLLTPCIAVPASWFPPLSGIKLLGLASGGGQQMPIFCAAGACCTVLDLSTRQLESERMVAERENYQIEIVQADMSKRLPFADQTFDLIFHPVSNVYIEDVNHLWRECFRILKPGGVLLAGLDNGFNFLIDDFTTRPLVITNTLPFNPLKNPSQMKKLKETDSGIQFSHSIEEQIGGQLRAGFILQDLYQDYNNDPSAIADGIPSYWATRAVKPS